ncbi:serine/threonine-protein kinase [Enemella dayhoffiae]|nr:serine/threonine-protein kinase [Enemella dayhoffiae]
MKSLGRYRLLEPLGSGAFATVWLAHDDEFELTVAVKVLADNWARDHEVRERFLNEAKLLRRIKSQRVVGVYDVGVAHGQPYFVMDHLPGGTVAGLMARGLRIDEAITVALDSCAAVEALHHEGVLHRDLKPSNLLLRRGLPDPFVAVADLGTAKLAAEASGITVTAGTPAYMAPELAFGMDGFDARADVYALAVLTFELLSGRKPIEVRAVADVLHRQPGPAPVALAAELGLPHEVDGLLQRSLSTERDHRPDSAAEYAERLSAALGGRTPTVLQRSVAGGSQHGTGRQPNTLPQTQPHTPGTPAPARSHGPTEVLAAAPSPAFPHTPAYAPASSGASPVPRERPPAPRQWSTPAVLLLALLLLVLSGGLGWWLAGILF